MESSNISPFKPYQEVQFFADKFKKFNYYLEKKDSLLKRIGFSFDTLFDERLTEAALHQAAHFGADHLAVGGITQREALVGVLKYTNPALPSPSMKLLNDDLNYALKIEEEIEEANQTFGVDEANKSLEKIAEKVARDLKQLKPGQSLTVPLGYSTLGRKGHSVFVEFVCAEIDPFSKQRVFKILLYNTGEGLGYHYSENDEKGHTRFQQVIEIVNVTQEALVKNLNRLFTMQNGLVAHDINEFYKCIAQLGKRAEKSHNPRYWSHAQLGNSCPSRSILAVARAKLPPNEFEEFKREIKTDLLFRLFKEIKGGYGNIETYPVVALELVKKLQHHFEKHFKDQPLPPELKQIRNDLEKLEKTQPIKSSFAQLYHTQLINQKGEGIPRDIVLEFPSKNKISLSCLIEDNELKAARYEDNLALAYVCLKDKNIPLAEKYYHDAWIAHSKEIGAITPDNKEKQTHLFLEFAQLFPSKHLKTLEEYNFYAAIACQIPQSILSTHKALQQFKADALQMYSDAHLDSYFPDKLWSNEVLNEIIRLKSKKS